MHILRIEHPVPDYDAWKQAFDSDPLNRPRTPAPCSGRPAASKAWALAGL
jgi:hypothetical protein